MSRTARVFLCVIAVAAATMLVSSVAASVAVYRAGLIVVRVHDKTPGGAHVSLVLPGILASAGAALVPREAAVRATPGLERWLPAVRAAVAGLEACEDGTLVEVEGREHVSIVKRGGSIVIDVDSPGETLHVSVPLGLASSIVARVFPEGPSSPSARLSV